MTDERDQIIEAGAKASYTAISDEHMPMWDDVDPMVRESFLADAAVQRDAMVPLIRQQAAEETRTATFDEIGIGLTIYAGFQPDAEAAIFRRAAQLVRQLGARPLDTANTEETRAP